MESLGGTLGQTCARVRSGGAAAGRQASFLAGSATTSLSSWSDLNSSHSLLYIFQEGFIFWALITILICIHVRQSSHVCIKILFIDWVLRDIK